MGMVWQEAMQRVHGRQIPREAVWTPQAGPQSAFADADAYEVLYGGAAGGGKTWALVHDGLTYAVQSGRALFLRRTFPELQEVIDLVLPTIQRLGGAWKEQKKRAEFANGGVLQFGYCATYRDVLQYQGTQWGWIGFDEIGLLAEERCWTFLISRNRSASPKLPRKMRATANPGGPGHAWLRRRFVDVCDAQGHATTVDGHSRAFIQAFLSDNPALVANDPEYGHRLDLLPELERAWLKEGDWTAGAGAALSELNRPKHLIPAFDVPKHWRWFGAFDWGFNHPFSFGLYTVDEDGNIYKVDTVLGRRLTPDAIASRIVDALHAHDLTPDRLDYTVAGHDCWADRKARGEMVPTIAEQFYAYGLGLDRANISRVAGLQNMRRYLQWKRPDGTEITPCFRMFDTPGNRRTFETLEGMVPDPTHLEDVLKVDADDRGLGGDDCYDETRYALASRPLSASPLRPAHPVGPGIDPWAHEPMPAQGPTTTLWTHDDDPDAIDPTALPDSTFAGLGAGF